MVNCLVALSLCCPVMDRWAVQGVARLLPNDLWRWAPAMRPSMDKRIKTMNGFSKMFPSAKKSGNVIVMRSKMADVCCDWSQKCKHCHYDHNQLWSCRNPSKHTETTFASSQMHTQMWARGLFWSLLCRRGEMRCFPSLYSLWIRWTAGEEGWGIVSWSKDELISPIATVKKEEEEGWRVETAQG